MSISWQKLIDSPTSEIHALARDLALEGDVAYYAKTLSFYLQGDRERLTELLATPSGNEHIDALAKLRLEIRLRTVKGKDLHDFTQLEMPDVLEAEKHFLLGLGWEMQDNDRMCGRHFAQAAAIYRTQGCPKKALRAFYNAIAADSRLNPHKSYVSEYQAVVQLSKEVGDAAFEGMALTMISREYQIQGLFEMSLEMVERALTLLQSERGCSHHGHALLQKAHVLLDLKRDSQVPALILEAEMTPFSEIQSAAKLLRVATDASLMWSRDLEKDLLPTWRNRVPQLTTRAKIGRAAEVTSELEERLLKIIYNGPVNKWDLIERLYPSGGSPLALENRLKNLLGRVRQKYPEKIVCLDGRYSLEKMPGGLI